MFEASMPPIKRAINKTVREPAKPVRAREKASINNEPIIVGLRPLSYCEMSGEDSALLDFHEKGIMRLTGTGNRR